MFPLRDDNPTTLTPVVTAGLVAVNVAVWFYLQSAGFRADALAESVCRYGMIPAEVTGATGEYAGVRLGRGTECRFGGLTWEGALTSIFLHGSWLHLIGNMWFLWLFGNNVEDAMGHLRFLLFYLLAGVLAAAAHVVSDPVSPVPVVGASGAISGVMGAYLLLYPRVRIETLFVLVFIVKIIAIPAWIVLLQWFALQLFYESLTPGDVGGVAYWAHIGGFVAGLILVWVFRNPRLAARARKRRA